MQGGRERVHKVKGCSKGFLRIVRQNRDPLETKGAHDDRTYLSTSCSNGLRSTTRTPHACSTEARRRGRGASVKLPHGMRIFRAARRISTRFHFHVHVKRGCDAADLTSHASPQQSRRLPHFSLDSVGAYVNHDSKPQGRERSCLRKIHPCPGYPHNGISRETATSRCATNQVTRALKHASASCMDIDSED